MRAHRAAGRKRPPGGAKHSLRGKRTSGRVCLAWRTLRSRPPSLQLVPAARAAPCQMYRACPAASRPFLHVTSCSPTCPAKRGGGGNVRHHQRQHHRQRGSAKGQHQLLGGCRQRAAPLAVGLRWRQTRPYKTGGAGVCGWQECSRSGVGGPSAPRRECWRRREAAVGEGVGGHRRGPPE